MRCEELRELIVLRAAGTLEPADESAVRTHLDAGCPVCAAEMAAALATVQMLPFALEQETPSPMAKARLMAAVRAESGSQAGRPAAAATRPAVRAGLAAAAVLVVVALSAIIVRQQQSIEAGRTLTASLTEQLERQGRELVSLTRQVRAARDSIRFVSSPGVLTVDLTGQGDRARTAARIFWDRARDSWQLYADNLPTPAAGRTYQLWLVTDAGVKISAGIFEPSPESPATGTVAVPPGSGTVVAAAITDEPSGGSPQPTTQPFLIGKI